MVDVDFESACSRNSGIPGSMLSGKQDSARRTGTRNAIYRMRMIEKEVAGKMVKPTSLAIMVLLLVTVNTFFFAPELSSPVSHSAKPYALLDSQWIAEGDQVRANFGYSVASAGDVNNDGYDDVIVGAQNYDNGQTDEGRAFLYLGSPSGLASAPSWTAESDQAYARFGYSVASAGDVNNDGYDDVVVGAYVYDNGESDEGRAYLYLGSSSGLSASPSWTAEGNQANAFFGSSVASAGDVNNDGFDDVLVAALFYSNGESMEGRVYLYLGSSSGLSASPSWITEGNQSFAYFGRSVSSAGDANNDGYDDVIIGAYYYDKGESNEGCAFLYLGSSSGLSVEPSWVGEGNQSDAWFGYSVSSAGDVNMDGYGDVVVGAVGYDNPERYEGRAFLYLGSSSGLSASPSWTAESNQADSYFGVVSSAGDVNNDGYDDVIVGAYFYDNDQLDEGRVFLYIGSSTGLPAAPSWTAESDQYSAMFGSSLSSAGDVNNDGYDEIIVGAYSFDNGQEDEGRVYLYYSLVAPPAQFDLVLAEGWNLVSIPLVDHAYWANTLGLLTGDVVSGWNSSSATYDKNFIVNMSPPRNDFAIEESTGYWVYTGVEEILHLSGSIPTATQTRDITVPSGGGWVIVGFAGLNTTRHASDVPGMYSGGVVSTVAGYNTTTGTYDVYITSIPRTDFLLVLGQAYWCYCSASGTMTYDP